MTIVQMGTIIDERYEITAQLGEGGMSVVYRAQRTDMQREVALKMLNAVLVEQPDKLARFRQEAQVISSLQHPNIVGVYAIGIAGSGIPYIVMELLEGHSLSELIQTRGALPWQEALPLYISVCSALSYAHERGIIHRDLKPSNFMVVETESGPLIKVVDFGIAKILSAEQGLTKTDVALGSVFYMSPGQCEGRAADMTSDVYALGCALFETLAGRPPFKADTHLLTLEEHRRRKPPAVRDLNPNVTVPAGLDRVIACCLEKDSQHRYATAGDLSADLQAVLAGAEPTRIPVSGAGHSARRSGSARRLLRAALPVISAACVVSLLYFFYVLSSQPQRVTSVPNGADRFGYVTLSQADLRVRADDLRKRMRDVRKPQVKRKSPALIAELNELERYLTDDPYTEAVLDEQASVLLLRLPPADTDESRQMVDLGMQYMQSACDKLEQARLIVASGDQGQIAVHMRSITDSIIDRELTDLDILRSYASARNQSDTANRAANKVISIGTTAGNLGYASPEELSLSHRPQAGCRRLQISRRSPQTICVLSEQAKARLALYCHTAAQTGCENRRAESRGRAGCHEDCESISWLSLSRAVLSMDASRLSRCWAKEVWELSIGPLIERCNGRWLSKY